MENPALLPEGFNLKSFLEANKKNNIESSNFISMLRSNYGNYTHLLLEQLKLYNKAKVKLPLHSENSCLFTLKSFEQSSSESLAVFKQKKFKGKSLLDLTGGLGIDDWAFSKSFKEVISVDKDIRLNEIARYNWRQMSIHNIKRIDADAGDFIKQDLKFDIIYIDSDRRVNFKGIKAVTLHDSEPSILKIRDRLFELSSNILLKLSPLADITYLFKTLKHIKKLYVVSLDNEVKEILALIEKHAPEKSEISAVDISENGFETGFVTGLPSLIQEEYVSDGRYFYEPSNVLIKSGLASEYAKVNGLMTIDKNSVYMLSDNFKNNYFGRAFKVISRILFSKSNVKKYLKLNGIKKANVSKRNFKLNTSEIYKLFDLAEGGEDYLFFTIDSSKQKLMFHCRKVK